MVKQRLGARTGNRRLAAEGRTETAEARLLRTKDKIKATARKIRREFRSAR
ncbi:hypothetical protein GCM10009555_041620 [Acrocarpospora macrocephala]|uniref:CsbD-like domain-containing protein n=2 Tax=Acrocarpospora macrocephala TaxID=150177 RepID=A0A5M3XDV1_9ACTN|nr:hypothetical protein Amac_106910 [Acrocarpospora macrocephala]